LRNARSTRFALAPKGSTLAVHRMAVAACLARSSLRAARSRGCMAAALSLGRVGAMGDQSTRMVRARPHCSIRECRHMARWHHGSLFRRRAELSRDRSAATGLEQRSAWTLGRFGDELAVAADPDRALAGDLRRAP